MQADEYADALEAAEMKFFGIVGGLGVKIKEMIAKGEEDTKPIMDQIKEEIKKHKKLAAELAEKFGVNNLEEMDSDSSDVEDEEEEELMELNFFGDAAWHAKNLGKSAAHGVVDFTADRAQDKVWSGLQELNFLNDAAWHAKGLAKSAAHGAVDMTANHAQDKVWNGLEL